MIKNYQIYRRASLYVSLSIYEGFGLTLLRQYNQSVRFFVATFQFLERFIKTVVNLLNPNNIAEITKGLKSILKSPKNKEN